MSAHADQQGLIVWYKKLSYTPKLALVHGEVEYQLILREELKQQLGITAKHKQLNYNYSFSKFKQTELIQYLNPVG